MKQYFKGCLISCADATDYPSVDVALQGYGYRVVELDGKEFQIQTYVKQYKAYPKKHLELLIEKVK